MEKQNFLHRIFRNPFLSLTILLGAFLVTLLIMTGVFAISHDAFFFYMGSTWANGTDFELIPSVWGYFQITIILAALIGAVYFDRIEKKLGQIDISWIFLVVAGVFLQLILTGIYTKIIW
ncbi:MAG TPA: hypothetical protein VMV49_01955 [Candidatus Deferrimicrobium sp.]|nr:hypothetical protein [Candidatus Deferrimicrobium sp.]